MTLVELMVAAIICAVGVMATISVLDTSREVSLKAELRESMSHQAEREMERIMSLPWAEFAHPSAPASSPTPTNPAFYVNGNSYAYDRNTPSASETFAINATTGLVDPASTAWVDGQNRLSGRVHRFVTNVSANARRVTVVVTANGAKAPAHVLVSSIKTNPTVS